VRNLYEIKISRRRAPRNDNFFCILYFLTAPYADELFFTRFDENIAVMRLKCKIKLMKDLQEEITFFNFMAKYGDKILRLFL